MILSGGMHPLFLLMAAIAIVIGLYQLYDRAPVLMPAIFLGSVLGLILRAVQLAKERRRQRDAKAVLSFAELRAKDLTRYRAWIKESLRGHDAVVEKVVSRLQQGLGLAAPGKTLGAFLLVGPTGTGKTYLAELMAKALYPDSEPILLRMNQYKDHEDVFTLIGPPPGYPGYEIGGALTRPVLDNPYRVVILDEFDQSHPDVKHCLYDILDRGQGREKSSGKTVHFNGCAFFATCNSGVDTLRAIWNESSDPIARMGRAREALAREGFERALLARFDEVHLMDTLAPMVVAEVACLQIAKHWKQYGIEVTYASPELLVEAVRRNTEFQEYGVRQLAHLIQELTTPTIEAARRSGSSRVRLELDPRTGQVTAAAA